MMSLTSKRVHTDISTAQGINVNLTDSFILKITLRIAQKSEQQETLDFLCKTDMSGQFQDIKV